MTRTVQAAEKNNGKKDSRRKERGAWIKRTLPVLVLLALFLCCPLAQAEEEAEWTMMIYLCGSDLESQNAMATFNLEELAAVLVPSAFSEEDEQQAGAGETSGRVNVLIETGGCAQWHVDERLEMNISTEALQRWRYVPYSWTSTEPLFTLLDEQPLASMGEPETLTAFIQWCAENYPAKKYGLLLWDHGGGAKTGIFLDELFDRDILYLNELSQALGDSGVRLEMIVFDACLMANLETAQAVAPYANYMIASEEISAGYGSAFNGWMRQLYVDPACDGRKFGFNFCVTTRKKYADLGDQQSRRMLTYSVINLSQIGRLGRCFDAFFTYVGRAYENSPNLMWTLNRIFEDAVRFGLNREGMLDLGSIFYAADISMLIPQSLLSETLDALTDAVVFAVSGDGRAGSTGLSFCYAVNLTGEELDIYAKNCQSPAYLAYLDAVTDWTAPDCVYSQAERLPEAAEMPVYQFDWNVVALENGLPAVAVDSAKRLVMGTNIYYELYRLDKKTGDFARLGLDCCMTEADPAYTDQVLFVMDQPEMWPSIEGQLCDIEYVGESGGEYLFNIPIRMNEQVYNLRCGYVYDGEAGIYTVYGLWDGYDEDSAMPSRNAANLAQYQGREYRLLYPVYNAKNSEKTFYSAGSPLTMYRSLEVRETALPPGEYGLRYILVDVFGRSIPLDMIRVSWDGNAYSILE